MEQIQVNKWFRSEVGAAFAVGASVAGVLIWIMSPVNNLNTSVAVIQNQIAELKSNDLTHIELKQTEQDANLASQQTQILDLNNKVTEILTILKKN